MSGYAKIYISMPPQFLADLDRTAEEEHLSRSALIREALKLYMAARRRGVPPRFFELTRSLRDRVGERSDEEIEDRIDQAVKHVRSRDGG